ncbi:MAG: foldase protein PrsA [Candidatus Sericytochromatia bacterium]|nr:MAG: foldase protein PrsA [Candidatus Sericytochromatia bacterium]
MSKKIKVIKLEDDYTKSGLIVALSVSAIIIIISISIAYFGTPPEKLYAARVNNDYVTKSEYNKAVERMKFQYVQLLRTDFNSPSGANILSEIQKNTLDNLINNKLLIQEAKKLDITVDRQEIQNRIDEIKKNNFNNDEKSFKDALKANGLTLSILKNSINEELLIEKVKNKILDDKFKTTDKELRDYYEKNKDLFDKKEKVKASHILVKDEKLANEILDKINKGEDFSKLAEKYSEDPGSKNKGGDLGFFAKGQMVPEFEKVAWDLKLNEVSKPVKTQFGFHIIKKTGFEKAEKFDFEKSKKEVENKLKEQKKTEILKNYIEELRKNAKIENYIFKPLESSITVSPPSSNPSASIKVITPSEKPSEKIMENHNKTK